MEKEEAAVAGDVTKGERIAQARAALARRHAEAPGKVPRYEQRQAHLATAARRDRDRLSDGWCILRTASRSTLALARSLASAGFDVWTPAEMRTRRTVRGSKVTREHEVAIAASFVFAKADRLPELAWVQAQPLSPHPSFSIFHHAGRVPLIADRDIAGLRSEEDRRRRAWEEAQRAKIKPPTFAAGTQVQIGEEPAFAGLPGTVDSQRGRKVRVNLGPLTVEVDAWQVLPNDIHGRQPSTGTAA